jgi:hypothetical protein
MNDEFLKATAMLAAEKAGKNANVAPQLLFGDIYMTLKDALTDALIDIAPQPPCTNEYVKEGCKQFAPTNEKPCPACRDQDEIACLRCATCKGEGFVQGSNASCLAPMGLVFFAFGVGLLLYVIITTITNWARP